VSGIAGICTITSVSAQNEKYKRFEIDVCVNFWTPSSQHLKATNSITQVYVDDNYASTGVIGGYGNSIAPDIDLTYYFKKNLGVTLGFSPIFMNNEMNIQESDTSSTIYENTGSIINFTLGLTGTISNSSNIKLFYGFGVNFVPNYTFTKHIEEGGNYFDIEASNLAFGFYFNTGMKIKLSKFISLKAGIDYSYLPADPEYSNSDGVKIFESANIGGIGLQTGLSFNF